MILHLSNLKNLTFGHIGIKEVGVQQYSEVKFSTPSKNDFSLVKF